MATRSEIYLEMPNGKFNSIYVHWDGYPSYNGRILQKYYDTFEKVEALINLGAVSSLGTNPFADFESNEDHTDGKRYDGYKPYVLDYHRWRGEEIEICKDQNAPSVREEYSYVYRKNKDGKYIWYVIEYDYLDGCKIEQTLANKLLDCE